LERLHDGLDVERVSFCRAEHEVHELGCYAPHADEIRDERFLVGAREAPEHDRLGLAERRRQSVARREEDEHRRRRHVARELRDDLLLDRVELVDVLEGEDDRLVARQLLHQVGDGSHEELARRGRRFGLRETAEGRDGTSFRVVERKHREPLEPGARDRGIAVRVEAERLRDDLAQRGERSLAERLRATHVHRHTAPLGERVQLAEETALAGAGVPLDREHGSAILGETLHRDAQHLELVGAPEPATVGRRRRRRRPCSTYAARVASPPARSQRRVPVEVPAVAAELEDPIAHEDLSDVRLRGEPLRELERVARRHEPDASARLPADQDLALVDADRRVEREPAQPEAARLADELVRARRARDRDRARQRAARRTGPCTCRSRTRSRILRSDRSPCGRGGGTRSAGGRGPRDRSRRELGEAGRLGDERDDGSALARCHPDDPPRGAWSRVVPVLCEPTAGRAVEVREIGREPLEVGGTRIDVVVAAERPRARTRPSPRHPRGARGGT
jgi:hypothetical protein